MNKHDVEVAKNVGDVSSGGVLVVTVVGYMNEILVALGIIWYLIRIGEWVCHRWNKWRGNKRCELKGE